MNKSVLSLLLGILFLLSFAFVGHGAGGNKIGVGFTAGYTIPTNENLSGGIIYGINVTYNVTKNLALELCGLRYQNDVTGTPDSLSDGKLASMPIQFGMQIRSPLTNRFIPYLSLGAGYYLNNFDIDSQVAAGWDALNFDIEEKIENALGFHLGVGMDFFFNPNMAVNVDSKYGICFCDGNWAITDRVSGIESNGLISEINFNMIMLTAGVKYFF